MVSSEISVQTLNHLGIIAGIIDEIGLVEQIDQRLGRHPLIDCQCGSGSQSDDSQRLRLCVCTPIPVREVF
jgi:hypothetical protein